jgi:hypothetical protein
MPITTLRGTSARISMILASEATYATTLLAIAMDSLVDPEATDDDDDERTTLKKMLEWHPTTRRMELEQMFGVEIPAINGDKLNAAIDILTADSFFQRPSAFIQWCNVLSGTPLAVGMFDKADADECAWGIVEGLLIAQPEEDEPFAEEILWYIGHVLDEEGIKTPPDVLRIAKREHKADFSGMSVSDPNMFQAEFKMQSDESHEIERVIKAKLIELLYELEQTPLKQGKTKDLRKRIGKGIQNVDND